LPKLKEGFGVWKEELLHDSYADEEARKREEENKERELHAKARSDMIMK
jgi:hypothetical protein